MPARSKSVAKKKKAGHEIVIPDKLYFRIGDVSELLQLPTYVLRFWETEFPQLKPTKSSSGQRMYRRREVELALRIRQLLYEEGFTIPGARERLKVEASPSKNQSALPFPKSSSNGGLKRVRQELQEILTMLSGKVKVEARKAATSRQS
ncbi:MAG TPA: MerR family transcriptional regulator [Terriglobales bacterium]|nr:MerR family transcriptional regulator [Terriglobales bacterium]